jgi:membrane protease YdiL (CAAX protease family)
MQRMIAPRTMGSTTPAGWYFGAAMLFTGGVVVGARLWFSTLQRVWPTNDATLEGIQFGSFLLVLGAVLAWVWEGDAGLRVGDTFQRWREVVAVGLVLSIVTWTFVVLTGSNVYSEADPLFELVLVPAGEELVFRGVLLGWLLSRLTYGRPAPTAARLAIIISAVAFGAGHASNALFGAGDFALVQVVAATVLGLIFGWLRIETRSIIAPILLHGVVNGVNLLG